MNESILGATFQVFWINGRDTWRRTANDLGTVVTPIKLIKHIGDYDTGAVSLPTCQKPTNKCI